MVDHKVIEVGEKALSRLEEARKMLFSSKTWEFRDFFFGSGGFTCYGKNSDLENTRIALEKVQESLCDFMDELEDVSQENLKKGEYLSFLEPKLDSFASIITDTARVSIILLDLDETIIRTKEILDILGFDE